MRDKTHRFRETVIGSSIDTDVALELSNIRVVLGEREVVSGISLKVPVGSFYGFIGPNGAGKSTTISVSAGLLKADDGVAKIFGYDVVENPVEAKSRFGLVVDSLPVFDLLTAREILQYNGLLRNMSIREIEKRSEELLEVLGLQKTTGKMIRDYSTGMTKKTILATALLHDPPLLILDEPLEAIDPASSDNIISVLNRYVKSGGTVILSSHNMESVESLCDHVAIFCDGEILSSGTLEQVCAGRGLDEVFFDLVGDKFVTDSELSWLEDKNV